MMDLYQRSPGTRVDKPTERHEVLGYSWKVSGELAVCTVRRSPWKRFQAL